MVDAPSVVKVNASEYLKSKAFDRAVAKRGPFHNSKNNFADGLIVESCLEFARGMMAENDHLIVVSENFKDFANPMDRREFHPDILADFNGQRASYSDNLAKVIGDIDPTQADTPLVARFEESLLERTATCPACKGTMYGHWLPSPGGLSWHFTCPKCGERFDTGEFYD